jgi:hypothetical protein
VALPPVATGTHKLPGHDKGKLRVRLTKLGRLLLLAGKEAERVYLLHHMHAHAPKLPLAIAVSFTAAG